MLQFFKKSFSFSENLVILGQETLRLSKAFKIKARQGGICLCEDKNHARFCRKFSWQKHTAITFLLDESPGLNICTFNWLVELSYEVNEKRGSKMRELLKVRGDFFRSEHVFNFELRFIFRSFWKTHKY